MDALTIALIGWCITVIGAVFIFFRKDGIEKANIKSAVNELRIVLKTRIEYSDNEREASNNRILCLEEESKVNTQRFTELIGTTNGLLKEHLAFHKGKESK